MYQELPISSLKTMKTIENELRKEIEKLTKEKKLLEIRLERESIANITKVILTKASQNVLVS